MKHDTLQTVIDSISITSDNLPHHTNTNWWMWIAITELIIIIVLMFRGRTNTDFEKKLAIKKKVVAEGEIDYANIVGSAFHAEPLYKELIINCHPDRFATDETKRAIADELSLRIAENKNNYKRLCELKEEAKTRLNINF